MTNSDETDALDVAVQLVFTPACGMALSTGSVKPLVSPAGTSITTRVVPAVESLIVTADAVALELAIMRPYKSKNVDATAVKGDCAAGDDFVVIACTIDFNIEGRAGIECYRSGV